MILLRALRDPAVALLWAGLATSGIGDQLFTVVLSWVAVGLFGTAAGYLTAAQAGVQLATLLLAGRWADRIAHRSVMIGADIGRAAILVMTAAVWFAAGNPPGWTLFACVGVLAIGMALFRPALQASLPQLVQDVALLPGANALLDTTERIARLLGPGLIGIASSVIPLVHFVTVDAGTFLVSAGCIAATGRIRAVPREAAVARDSMLANVIRGWRAVFRHPLLGFVLAITGLINGAWFATFFLGLPLILDHAGMGLASYGLVISAYGSTNLLATLIVGNRRMSRHPGRLIFSGNLALGAGIVLVGLAPLLVAPAYLLPALMAAAGVAAVGGPMQDIMVAVLRQTELPRADLPAAVRAFMVSNTLGTLVALAAAPTLFNVLGVPHAVMACGALLISAALVGLTRFWEGAGSAPRPRDLEGAR